MASPLRALRQWDRLSVGLMLAIALLGAVIYFEISAGLFAPPPLSTLSGAVSGERLTTAPPLERGVTLARDLDAQRDAAVADVDVILSRPLFRRERRPNAERPTAPRPAVGGLRRLTLAATARDGARSVALLQGGSRAEYHRLSPGDELNGWRLLDIGPNGALFEAVDAATAARSGDGARRVIIDRDGARSVAEEEQDAQKSKTP